MKQLNIKGNLTHLSKYFKANKNVSGLLSRNQKKTDWLIDWLVDLFIYLFITLAFLHCAEMWETCCTSYSTFCSATTWTPALTLVHVLPTFVFRSDICAAFHWTVTLCFCLVQDCLRFIWLSTNVLQRSWDPLACDAILSQRRVVDAMRGRLDFWQQSGGCAAAGRFRGENANVVYGFAIRRRYPMNRL